MRKPLFSNFSVFRLNLRRSKCAALFWWSMSKKDKQAASDPKSLSLHWMTWERQPIGGVHLVLGTHQLVVPMAKESKLSEFTCSALRDSNSSFTRSTFIGSTVPFILSFGEIPNAQHICLCEHHYPLCCKWCSLSKILCAFRYHNHTNFTRLHGIPVIDKSC